MTITFEEVKKRQNLTLDEKIAWANNRIDEWYTAWEGNVYVSFSGGKDSTVLLDIVRKKYRDVPAVFVNTGLEFPEIVEFVKSFQNLIILKPRISFIEVLNRYGYPVISKSQACAISRYRNTKSEIQRYRRLNGWPNGKKGMISKKYQYLIDAPFKISDECCNVMKIQPIKSYIKLSKRYGMNGSMASDSIKRACQYSKYGCNSFNTKEPISRPLSIWTEKDIWDYIYREGIKYCGIYDLGYSRTGCVFCMFGCGMEKEPRFVKLKNTHPKLYQYCLEYLRMKEVLDYLKIPY